MRGKPTKSVGQAVLAVVLVAGLWLLPFLLARGDRPGPQMQTDSPTPNFNVTISCAGKKLYLDPLTYLMPEFYEDEACTKPITGYGCNGGGDAIACPLVLGDGIDTVYVRLPQLRQAVTVEGVSQPVSEIGTPLELDGEPLLTVTEVIVTPPGLNETEPTATFHFTVECSDVVPQDFTLTLDGETCSSSLFSLDGNGEGEVVFPLPDGGADTPANVRVAGGTIAVTELLTPVDTGDLILTPSNTDTALVLLP